MGKQHRVGVYPGTFDPVTNGHMDVVIRALRLVDQLVIAPAISEGKGPIFSIADRVAILEDEIAHLEEPGLAARISVKPFDNLLMQFAESLGATIVIKGLRAVSDFEYEFQMSSLNAHLNPGVESVFLMSSDRHQFISSRFIREISRMGGDVSPFVSPRVKSRLEKLFANKNG